MIERLSHAPLHQRLKWVRQQIQPGQRKTVSALQGYLLRNVTTPEHAVTLLVGMIAMALHETWQVPHHDSADSHLRQALAIALAHPQAPSQEAILERLEEPLHSELKGHLADRSPAWSAPKLEWELSLTLAQGWPDREVDLETPLGEWRTGDADPVFQSLLAVTVLEAWGLLG